MHEYHELTERIKHYGNWRDTDRAIRAYLKEKAEEMSKEHDTSKCRKCGAEYGVWWGKDFFIKHLGLTKKSLEEKFKENAVYGNKLIDRSGNEISKLISNWKELAEIAEDHFNQQGER